MVTGDQTDNVVGRTSAYYATPTTKTAAASPKLFLLSFGFAVPSLLPLVVYTLFSRTAVLFCLLPHLRGGHDTS